MSMALARLRRILGDPLLVKEGRGMALTPLAESLVDQVAELMTDIGSVLGAGASFDPATDHRNFTLLGSDYAMQVLLGPLLRELTHVAPGVRLTILSLQPSHIDALRRGQHDLLLWPADVAGVDLSAFSSRVLFVDSLVGVVADDHPDVGDRLTAEQLSTLPCIEVRGPGPSLSSTGFDELNMPRRVVATTETFTATANMIAGTRMFAVVQRRLFDRLGTMIGLRAVDVDVPLPRLVESMYWRRSGPPLAAVDRLAAGRTAGLRAGGRLSRPPGGRCRAGVSAPAGVSRRDDGRCARRTRGVTRPAATSRPNSSGGRGWSARRAPPRRPRSGGSPRSATVHGA
jgi:DNA-binding transcriptional LysR family regulator